MLTWNQEHERLTVFFTFTCGPPAPPVPFHLHSPLPSPSTAVANVATIQKYPLPFPAAPLIAFITVSMGAAARSNLLIMCCISGGPGAGMEHRGMPGSASGSPAFTLPSQGPPPVRLMEAGPAFHLVAPPTHPAPPLTPATHL